MEPLDEPLALQFLDRFDIMFESKDKNLATLDYFNDYLA
ncbi:UNVERIFIED_ORG: hypothetical protein J2W65_001172 [Pseudomonas parafulva]|nr:hypothetical protein [Pseudomonas parafulva]